MNAFYVHLDRRRWLGAAAAGALLVAAVVVPAWASDAAGPPVATLDVWTMCVGLLGGLALFLFGMEQMSDALKALAGERLKDVLARLTTNRYMGAVTGAVVTAIIQSSSVTTVLTVGFITAGILSVSQSVGIIFGANIGTTLTAQIIAFKVTKYALLMIAVGFGALFLSHNDRTRQYGAMVMGLGLVFFGMSVMSDAMKPLRSYQPFLDLMAHMANPVLGILVAAAFTGLVQSSSATTGVIIAMASQGLITLPAGIALVFGANIGTCVTALLASLGKPRNALRASLVHILFNVVGVVAWVFFIDQLAALVTWLSPVSSGLSGHAKLAAEAPRQIANAHTVFNVANTLILLPLGAQFARLVEYLIPEHDEERQVTTGAAPEWTAVHLDPALVTVPSVALEQSRGELVRLGGVLRDMLAEALAALRENAAHADEDLLGRSEQVRDMDDQIDAFLIQISRRSLNEEQSLFASQLIDVSGHLEHVEALVRKDMVPLLQRGEAQHLSLASAGADPVFDFFGETLRWMDTALTAFDANDAEGARLVVRARNDYEHQLRACRASLYERPGASAEDPATVLQLDLLDQLRRAFGYCESIAFTMLHGYLDQRKGARPAA